MYVCMYLSTHVHIYVSKNVDIEYPSIAQVSAKLVASVDGLASDTFFVLSALEEPPFLPTQLLRADTYAALRDVSPAPLEGLFAFSIFDKWGVVVIARWCFPGQCGNSHVCRAQTLG